ncbi:hypothetical protein GCM10023078_10350 [Gibbsiella greigii]
MKGVGSCILRLGTVILYKEQNVSMTGYLWGHIHADDFLPVIGRYCGIFLA